MNGLHGRRHSTRMGLLAAGLLLPVLAACGGDAHGEGVRTAQPAEDARDPAGATRSASPRLSPQEQANQPLRISEMGYNEGSPSAPVKVMEISDFGCGYCRRFHLETYPSLKSIYIEAGLVEWKHVPYVLGMFPNGLQAATAAECAGEQDRFFDMQRALYESQAGWRSSQEPYEMFSEMAAREGLDAERFRTCLQGGWRDDRVTANVRLGRQAGVRGTPSFLIEGHLLPGALALEDFREVLDAALTMKGVTPPPR